LAGHLVCPSGKRAIIGRSTWYRADDFRSHRGARLRRQSDDGAGRRRRLERATLVERALADASTDGHIRHAPDALGKALLDLAAEGRPQDAPPDPLAPRMVVRPA
jgi:hypothetical protein